MSRKKDIDRILSLLAISRDRDRARAKFGPLTAREIRAIRKDLDSLREEQDKDVEAARRFQEARRIASAAISPALNAFNEMSANYPYASATG